MSAGSTVGQIERGEAVLSPRENRVSLDVEARRAARLVTHGDEARRGRDAAFDVRRESVKKAVRAYVREVAVRAEVAAQARFGTELDAVEARVVIVDAHQHRTRGSGDEDKAVGIL